MFHRKSPKNLPSSSECKYFKQVFIMGSYRKTFEERAWIWDERVLEPYDIISWMLFWENCRNIGDYEERRQQNSWILLMINLRLGKKPELHLLVEVFWVFMRFREERYAKKSIFHEIEKNYFPRRLEKWKIIKITNEKLECQRKVNYWVYDIWDDQILKKLAKHWCKLSEEIFESFGKRIQGCNFLKLAWKWIYWEKAKRNKIYGDLTRSGREFIFMKS